MRCLTNMRDTDALPLGACPSLKRLSERKTS